MQIATEQVVIRHHLEQLSLADSRRFDANETAFLEREITQRRSQVKETLYAELMALKFIPIASDIAAWATQYAYKVLDFTGKAKIIGNAADDLPAVDVNAFERTGKSYPIGASYSWTKDEMATAAATGVALPTYLVRAAAKAIDEAIDTMLAFGTVDTQTSTVTTGFYNNADVLGVANANVIAGTFWQASTSPDTILGEMNSWVTEIVDESMQLHRPDTIVFAPREFMLISQKKVGTDNDKTILRSFLENNPFIKNVDMWYRGNLAGVNGTENRAVVYKRDPMVLEGVVNQQFTQEPPQLRNLASVTNCTAKAGGVKVYYPRAMRYVDQAQA